MALTFRSAMVGLRSDVLFLSLFLARVPAGASDTSRGTTGCSRKLGAPKRELVS
jgi:hypothetical protein